MQKVPEVSGAFFIGRAGLNTGIRLQDTRQGTLRVRQDPERFAGKP